MLINVDRNLCIGAAPCVAIAGNVFQLDDEGKAVVIGASTDDTNTRLAAEACPVRAIFLYDEKQQQLFPPASEMPRPYVEEHPADGAAPSAPAAAPVTTLENPKAANDNASPSAPAKAA